MGFLSSSKGSTNSTRLIIRNCMLSILVLGLVFTVAPYQGIIRSWSLEKVDGGLMVKQHMRKLLMVSMDTHVTADYDGSGDTGPGDGSGIGDGDGGIGIGRAGGGIGGGRCSRNSIEVNQGPTAPLPSGIPTYTVIIENVCMSGCSVSDIHLRCEWFSSARTINPHVFRRIDYDDCLFNDGNPLPAGRSLSFQYANTFPYPLSVSTLTCLV